MDEKDRLGDKLHEAERGHENQYFARRERELLAKLKSTNAHDAEATRPAASARCPTCGEPLHDADPSECPACRKVRVGTGDLKRVAVQDSEPVVSRWLRGLMRR